MGELTLKAVIDIDLKQKKRVAYNRKRYLVDGKLECPSCNEWKPIEDYHKDKSAIYGVTRYCKVCANRKARKYHKENNAPGQPNNENYRRYYKNYQLVNTYCITLEEYEKILDRQNGLCDICHIELSYERDENMAHLDHCHATNKIRGILCVRCNQGLGYFLDNIDTLNNAVIYLNKHRGVGNE